MNSRLALSAFLILIAAMVLASQGAGLRDKFHFLRTSCAGKISETRSLFVLYHSCTRGKHAGAIPSPHTRIVTSGFPDATHCLGSQARHLQSFVSHLIDSDHQGE